MRRTHRAPGAPTLLTLAALMVVPPLAAPTAYAQTPEAPGRATVDPPPQAGADSAAQAPAEAAAAETIPPGPEASHPMASRVRVAAAYRMGFGGTIEYDLDGAFGTPNQIRDDLQRTDSLLMLRVEGPIGRYFAIGGMLQGSLINSQRADSTGESALSVFDLGLLLRARYTIDLGTVALEPSVTVPFGFSVGVFDKDFSGQPGFGWHAGVLFGGQVLIGERFGVLLEMGWLRHRLGVDARSSDATVTVSQGTLMAGVLLGFGGD